MSELQRSESVWVSDAAFPFFPTLDKIDPVKVIVIGGGISGLTTGILLQRAGFSTAIIEQDRIGSGETSRTSAHLTEYPDAGFSRIATDFGIEGAQAILRSTREALRLIEALASEVPCDFERVSGFLYSDHARDRTALQQELEAAAEAGLPGRFLDAAPLPFPTAGALEFPHQAQFHPAKYLGGLVRLYVTAGGMVSEQSHVRSIDEEDNRCRVRTDRGVAYADHVVVVTDAPITGDTLLETKLIANRSYMMALRIAESGFPSGLFWDRDDPYHYLRSAVTGDGPIVIVGGEDHRTGAGDDARDAVVRLEGFARERFPVALVVKQWSGQIMETVDGLPFIGPREEGSRVYLATGYAGNGLTFGTVAAQLLCSLIRGVGTPYAEWYAPNRTLAPRQWAKYAAQNLPAAWTLVSDLIPSPRGESVDEIEPGEGKIIRLHGHKVAACRDHSGQLHLVSSHCTHLGCEVGWNNFEQSWDCPCHGSRFDPAGHVLHGPARAPLQPQEHPVEPLREPSASGEAQP